MKIRLKSQRSKNIPVRVATTTVAIPITAAITAALVSVVAAAVAAAATTTTAAVSAVAHFRDCLLMAARRFVMDSVGGG